MSTYGATEKPAWFADDDGETDVVVELGDAEVVVDDGDVVAPAAMSPFQDAFVTLSFPPAVEPAPFQTLTTLLGQVATKLTVQSF